MTDLGLVHDCDPVTPQRGAPMFELLLQARNRAEAASIAAMKSGDMNRSHFYDFASRRIEALRAELKAVENSL